MLESRLPTRERELRAVRRAPYDSWYERLDAYKAFSARYPDFHTAQYVTGDEIIHRGPLYGVAMREALPYVDRLDELAPTHADNAFHRLIVATAIADTTLTRVAARQLRERMGVQSGAFLPPCSTTLSGRLPFRRRTLRRRCNRRQSSRVCRQP